MINFTKIVELVIESFIPPHPNLKQLLNNVVLPRGENKHFKLVWINVDKFDDLFSKDGDFYIGQGGKGGIGDRYNRFIEFLDKGEEKRILPYSSTFSSRIFYGWEMESYVYQRQTSLLSF